MKIAVSERLRFLFFNIVMPAAGRAKGLVEMGKRSRLRKALGILAIKAAVNKLEIGRAIPKASSDKLFAFELRDEHIDTALKVIELAADAAETEEGKRISDIVWDDVSVFEEALRAAVPYPLPEGVVDYDPAGDNWDPPPLPKPTDPDAVVCPRCKLVFRPEELT